MTITAQRPRRRQGAAPHRAETSGGGGGGICPGREEGSSTRHPCRRPVRPIPAERPCPGRPCRWADGGGLAAAESPLLPEELPGRCCSGHLPPGAVGVPGPARRRRRSLCSGTVTAASGVQPPLRNRFQLSRADFCNLMGAEIGRSGGRSGPEANPAAARPRSAISGDAGDELLTAGIRGNTCQLELSSDRRRDPLIRSAGGGGVMKGNTDRASGGHHALTQRRRRLRPLARSADTPAKALTAAERDSRVMARALY